MSELLHRRGVSLLCLSACTIAAVLLWQLGAVATGIAASREERLAAEEPTAVRVRVADAADRTQWFDATRLHEVASLPWVAAGGPLVEVHVVASLAGGRERLVPAEGDVRAVGPAPVAMAWGQGPVDRGAVMLSRSLFESLGGVLGPMGPEPGELTVQIARTVDGQDQRFSAILEIVGLTKREHDTDRLDIDRALALSLDRWCQGEDVDGMPRRKQDLERHQQGADFADLSVQPESSALLQRELQAMGIMVQSTASVGGSLTMRVARSDGRHLERSQLVRIELIQPAVVSVAAAFTAVATRSSEPVRLLAYSDAGSPVCADGVVWPRGDGVRVGERVRLDFSADDGAVCQLEFDVEGHTDGPDAIVAASVLGEVVTWQRGRSTFDAAERRFVPLPPATSQAGCLRATFYAKTLEQVEPLVAHLHSLGYETTDQLARFLSVRWFGRAVGLLVAGIVLGTLLLAMMMVFGMNMQKLAVSVFEIGLLRAQGVPDGRIVGIYSLQGLLLGGAALLLAATVQRIGAPWVHRVLADAFGLDIAGVVNGSVFGPAGLVFAVVAVCLGCATLGTTVPAWWTCRRVDPVAALRAG